MDARELLTDWLVRIRMAQRAHFRSSVYFARANYLVGSSAVVLSTVAGSSAFAALNRPEQIAWMTLAVGCISLIAATLSGIQTFLRLSERSEQHRSIAVRLSELKKEIEQTLVFFPDTLEEQKQIIESCRQRWTQIINESPTALDREFISIYGKLVGGEPIKTGVGKQQA